MGTQQVPKTPLKTNDKQTAVKKTNKPATLHSKGKFAPAQKTETNAKTIVDKPKPVNHKAGSDYKTGTIVAPGKIYLETDETGKETLTDKEKHKLYFKQGDSVTFIQSSEKEHDNWIEVKGTAHYEADKKTTDIENTTGWVQRNDTNMTLGLFEGLNIQDKTAEFKQLTLSSSIDPIEGVVLHNTGGSTSTGAEGQYRTRMSTVDSKGNPKKQEHVGAQYLISEYGEISEIIPINHRVGHAVGDKYLGRNHPKVLPQLWKVYKAKNASAAEMEKVRKDIDKHYLNLTTELLTDYYYHYLKSLSNSALFDLLNDNHHDWNLFPHTVKNQTAIGIEVVGAPKNIASDLGFSTNQRHDRSGIIAEIDRLVKAKKLTETQKDKALQSDERKKIGEEDYKDEESKNKALNDFDKKILKNLQDNGWVIDGVAIAAPETFKALKAQGKADQFLTEVSSLNLSPALKAQLLKTKQREEIQSKLKNSKSQAEKDGYEKQLDNLNGELFSFLRASGFNVYEEINGAQKLSSWLVVKSLAKQFNLDVNKDVYAHPEIDSKVFGEGQNNLEFIHAMSDFETKVNTLKAETDKKPEITKAIADYSNVIELINKGDFKNPAVKAFFANFYERKAEFDQLYNKYK